MRVGFQNEPGSEREKWQPPKVSVLMIAYNQEKFISQAIESVLMQETDFPVELVIGEDCSTDGTRRIVEEYAKKHPDRIRPLYRTTNLGVNVNFAGTLAACNGEYVALLDGDDYWTDARKLAKQTAFLDGHPECAICFHNAFVFTDGLNNDEPGLNANRTGNQLLCRPGMQTRYSQTELLKGNVIPYCSVMFRRTAAGTLPAWFEKLSIEDLPLYILCAEHGPAAYLNEVMAAYRLHPNSHWSSKSRQAKAVLEIKMYEELERYFHSRPRSAAVRKCRLQATRSLARARVESEVLLEGSRARSLMENGDLSAVPSAVLRIWRLQPRWKWLRWYLRLVWPKSLGGTKVARYVHQKILNQW